MEYTRLGRTGLSVSRTSFGALPIQRIPESESTAILRAAYEAGINFYDTANAYTDSEFKARSGPGRCPPEYHHRHQNRPRRPGGHAAAPGAKP